MTTVTKLRTEVVGGGDRKHRAAAREWVGREGIAYVRRTHLQTDPRDAEPKLTVADVMSYLDGKDAPVGYTGLATDNAARYQLVRGVLEGAVRDGKLRPGTTVNTKGRQAQCFLPVPTQPNYSVMIDAENAGAVEQSLRTWLSANETALEQGGFRGLLITSRGAAGA